MIHLLYLHKGAVLISIARKTHRDTTAVAWFCVVALAMMLPLGLTGCSSYHLAGTVISGSQSTVLVVDKNDSRLQQPGINGASLMFTIDPDSLNASSLPVDITDGNGSFSVPVSQTGAGFLEYDLLALCRAPGYVSASRKMPLPSGSKRLLIVLSPGKDTYTPDHNIVNETIDMGKRLTPHQ